MERENISIAEGGGGKQGNRLIQNVFLRAYGNEILNKLEDAAECDIAGSRIAFTTDSFTIKPVFFPGGDIGKLAVCGTVNDLAVKGARPRALAAAFIIEEGFPKKDLSAIAESMQKTASESGVSIVAGDTKVVSRGEADGIFITTAGIGTVMDSMNVSVRCACKGDVVISTGTIADHGICIMNAREGLGFSSPITSDVSPVISLVEKLAPLAEHIHVMRDPTRGGVAGIVNEIALASRVLITLKEKEIPLKQEVASCCDLLGIDPLYMANEGKIILVVAEHAAQDILTLLRQVPLGRQAAVIGQVSREAFRSDVPPVSLETLLGTSRFLPLLEGDPLPRIC